MHRYFDHIELRVYARNLVYMQQYFAATIQPIKHDSILTANLKSFTRKKKNCFQAYEAKTFDDNMYTACIQKKVVPRLSFLTTDNNSRFASKTEMKVFKTYVHPKWA